MGYKPKARENRLSQEEIKIILNACKSGKEKLLIAGEIFTGLRVSEFIHLRRSWIDFDKKIITIPLSMPCSCNECKKERFKNKYKRDYKDGGVIIKRKIGMIQSKPKKTWKAKTKKSARVIPIVPEIMNLFLSYFKKHRTIIETIKDRKRAHTMVVRVAKRTNIPHKVFNHCFRATFASILAEKGFDGFQIQAMLGWEDISTAQFYVAMSGTAVVEAINKKW